MQILVKFKGHSGVHQKCNPALGKNRPVFYPTGKPYTVSPLLARVRSTLVRLHPYRLGSAASSIFVTFRFIEGYPDLLQPLDIFNHIIIRVADVNPRRPGVFQRPFNDRDMMVLDQFECPVHILAGEGQMRTIWRLDCRLGEGFPAQPLEQFQVSTG